MFWVIGREALKKLKKQKGFAVSLDFIIVFILIFLVVWGFSDYWLNYLKIQQGEHIKNKYLDRVKLEGWLTEQDAANMIKEYEDLGFEVSAINEPRTAMGTRIRRALPGETASISEQEVWLTVKVKLTPSFLLGKFFNDQEELQITYKGTALSEYVP